MKENLEVILFLLLLLASVQGYGKKSGTKVYFRYLPYIMIFIFMSFRSDYGDGATYRIAFEYLHLGINPEGIEPLYMLLNQISPNFRTVVVVTSLFYVFALYLVVSNTLNFAQRKFALMIIALHPYILMVDMSAIRQSVAIACVVIGVYTGNRYKRVYYIALCLIAALFHKSAIIMLPMFFLLKKGRFPKKAKLLLISATALVIAVPNLLFKIVELLLKIVRLNTGNYLSYLYNGNKNGILAVTLSLLMVAFFALFDNTIEKENSIYGNLAILAMVFEALQGVVQQFGRIDMYFLPFLAIALPLILKGEEKRLKINTSRGALVFNQYICRFVELCFVLIFIWKLVNFMTPQYMYRSVLFAS